MKSSTIEQKIAEYLNGEMTPQQKEELKEFLMQNGYNVNELADLENLFGQLDNYQVPEPGEKMDDQFYAMLEGFKEKEVTRERRREEAVAFFKFPFLRTIFPKIAYSLLLLLIGWIAGNRMTPGSKYENQIHQMNSQIHDMREVLMLTLLDQPSATERIKAVNITNNFKNVDDRIINALLYTLNNDPNENVRLVTVEALLDFADNSQVREGLVQSISKQQSPLVQIALADAMLALREKRAVEQFRQLLEKKDLNDTVRNRLVKTVNYLM